LRVSKAVLIVDDEPDIITYLSIALNENGYETLSARSADAGFRIVENSMPDLVCLDIMMPMKSGISLYLRLKNDLRFKDIPVLIISGVVRDDDFDIESYTAGETAPAPDGFLEKPVDVSRLIEIVEGLTRDRRENSRNQVG
jgi:CheY-like chemotaxis protein